MGVCGDMPARAEVKGTVKPTGYFSCEVCHASAVPVVVKQKKVHKSGNHDEDEDQESKRTVLTWPARTMGKELRTLDSVREQSEKAKNNPGIDPKTNFGQKGNIQSLLVILLSTLFHSFLQLRTSSLESLTLIP